MTDPSPNLPAGRPDAALPELSDSDKALCYTIALGYDMHDEPDSLAGIAELAMRHGLARASESAQGEQGFIEWFGRNYYGTVEFGDPAWHARSIYRNATWQAKNSAPAQAVAPSDEGYCEWPEWAPVESATQPVAVYHTKGGVEWNESAVDRHGFVNLANGTKLYAAPISAPDAEAVTLPPREAFEAWACSEYTKLESTDFELQTGGAFKGEYRSSQVEELWSAWQARASQPVEAGAVAGGWQLVPKEPTLEMLHAMSGNWTTVGKAMTRYKAMLDAAAAHPAPPDAVAKDES